MKFDGLIVGESILRIQSRQALERQRSLAASGGDNGGDELVFRKRKVGPAITAMSRFGQVCWSSGQPVRFLDPLDPLVVSIHVRSDGGLDVKVMMDAVREAASAQRARVVSEDPSWIWIGDCMVQANVGLPASVLDLLISGIIVPSADQEEFLGDYLPSLRGAGVSLEINGTSMALGSNQPKTYLDMSEDSRGLWARLSMSYGSVEVPPAAAMERQQRSGLKVSSLPASQMAARKGGPNSPSRLTLDSRPEEILLRDLSHEQDSMDRLDESLRNLSVERSRGVHIVRASQGISKDKALARGTVLQPDPGSILMTGQVALRFLYAELPRLSKIFEVRGLTKLRIYGISRDAGTISMKVGITGKKINLEGALSTSEGTASMPGIVRSLASGTRFVRLDSGKIAQLPAEWVNHDTWSSLAGVLPKEGARRPKDAALKLPLHMIGWILECGELTGNLQETPEWVEFKEKLLDFKGIQPVPVPEALQTTLRGYQGQCLEWLNFLNENFLGGILADDMGLGKTVQALTMLLYLKNTKKTKGTSLIVCPTSVLENWRRESLRFCPDLRVSIYHGRNRGRLLENMADHDILLTTYGILRRDMKWLKKRKFQYAILDESQNIKSLSTATTVSAFSLNADHRLCLTGTPVENSALELYSQMNFLMPGILGSVRRFKKAFLEGDQLTRKDRMGVLRSRVKPFVLRRTKEQVTPELPAKQIIQLTCTLEGGAARLYRDILAMTRDEVFSTIDRQGMGKSQLTILQALLRLRQVCCHPALLAHLDPSVKNLGSPKMDMLMEILESVVSEGHKVLVFSQFTSMLAIIRKKLDSINSPYMYLDGKTRNRQDLVDVFNSEKGGPIFLMSLKAGGTGLNLTGADYVIHYDPWWNPAVMDQATARTHRIGQTRKVIAYNLIVKESIEEKVVKLADRKRELACELIPSDEEFGKSLTREDLEELFAPLP